MGDDLKSSNSQNSELDKTFKGDSFSKLSKRKDMKPVTCLKTTIFKI